MSKQPPTDEFGDTNESTNSINRRRFVKSLGAAGGVGAFGATGMTGNAAAKESQEPFVDPQSLIATSLPRTLRSTTPKPTLPPAHHPEIRLSLRKLLRAQAQGSMSRRFRTEFQSSAGPTSY